jgi:peptide/nickel transport system substrate-binding protein
MADNDFSRRLFLQTAVYAGGGSMALLACTAGGPSPNSSAGGPAIGALPDLEGGQVITDPAQFPKVFKESPEFAKQVAAGTLPPVAERIGRDPLVIKPLHQIGRYGGTLRRGFLGISDAQNANRFCAGPDNLLYWDYTRERVIPNIARSFELSDGDRTLTLHLRRGMKWSDGAPFTADDIIFWRDDINLNEQIGLPASGLRAADQNVLVRKVDDYTVQYISPVRNNLLPAIMAGWSDISGLTVNGRTGNGGFAPKHYLAQFLPKYSSESAVQRLAADAGFPSWMEYIKNRNSWDRNPDLPVLSPWIVTRPINDPPWQFSANPYSIWVDTSGNQLPYIATVTMANTENQEVINLRAASGEYDFQDRHLAIANLPALLGNQDRGNYTVYRAPSDGIDFGLRINLAYNSDEELGELLRTVDFRRAISLGIDRNEIIQTFFLGTSKPTSTLVTDDSDYFPGAEWRTKWATHDPRTANALLDKVGLTRKDGSGYRLRADGNRRLQLDYQVGPGWADFAGIGEMIKNHWRQIGIELRVQKIDGNLLLQRAVANELMLSGHTVGTYDPFIFPDMFLPTITNHYSGMIGIPYAEWFISKGKDGVEPPAGLQLLKTAIRLRQAGMRAPEKERIEIGKQLFRLHVDQVWSIGVAGFGLSTYGIYIANKRLGNVPRRMFNSEATKSPCIGLPMTFFYK